MAKDSRDTFVKLYRSMKEWGWYDDLPTKALFIELLLIVNIEDKEWHGMTIHRGEIITSTAKLAASTGLTQMQVRRALKNLESTGEITRSVTNKYTRINVENYRVYQDKPSEDNKQTTSKQQTNNNQTTTTKEYKNIRIKERERDALPLVAFGRKKNVFLTADEKDKIKTTFENHQKLINKIGDIIANSNRDYPDHDALLWKIAEEDGWPKKTKRQPSRSGELTEAEKEAIRRQEEEWRNA
jgi:DNA-binding MarR family transcriptional regulator